MSSNDNSKGGEYIRNRDGGHLRLFSIRHKQLTYFFGSDGTQMVHGLRLDVFLFTFSFLDLLEFRSPFLLYVQYRFTTLTPWLTVLLSSLTRYLRQRGRTQKQTLFSGHIKILSHKRIMYWYRL